jgi:predicted aspartyl protease
MLVRRRTPTHPLEAMFKASNRLWLPARGSVSPESTKSVLMLLLMVLILLLIHFYINSVPAAILFDSGATHLFISARYVNTKELPLQTMQKPMIVITPKGPIESNYMTNRLTLTIMGREFWSMPIVLEESSIDLILGMSWLRKENAVIHCARGTVELTSPKGEKFKVMVTITPYTIPAIYLVEGKFVGRNIHFVREFPNVFPEELSGMPLDREVEFVIDLLLETTPI